MLTAEAQQVFDRLAVFPGTFDLEAVHAVTRDGSAGSWAPADVARLMGDLVAKSLVVHEAATGRYRLLETIRIFAEQRLADSGLVRRLAEALRQHAVARAREEGRARAWLSTSLAARSREDLDNVRLAFGASLTAGDASAALDLALGLSTLWRNAVSYAEGRRWVSALLEQEMSPRDRLWTLILEADVGLGSGDPLLMRQAVDDAAALGAVDDEPAMVVLSIYGAMVRLLDPQRAADRLADAVDRARAAGEPGLERLARGFRMVALRMSGITDGLRDEGRALTDGAPEQDYPRYLCHWAASLVALLDRDSAWLSHLMDQQRDDLAATALYENWLTLYWGALALIAEGADFVPQLRRSRNAPRPRAGPPPPTACSRSRTPLRATSSGSGRPSCSPRRMASSCTTPLDSSIKRFCATNWSGRSWIQPCSTPVPCAAASSTSKPFCASTTCSRPESRRARSRL